MDFVALRRAVGRAAGGLTMYTHAQLGEACERLGLPQSPEGTKHERVSHSFAALPHADLPMVAERIFGVGGDRNRIERSVPGLSENRGVTTHPLAAMR
jgi:hypothetical protein